MAAPILPHSSSQKEAAELFTEFHKAKGPRKTDQLKKIKEKKLLSPYYQHSDGTSFAAPIVCSIIAQMLEANPGLNPNMIREILFNSARPLSGEDRTRQGYGVVQAASAVILAKNEKHLNWRISSPVLDFVNDRIHFLFHHHNAKTVTLSGSFNQWAVGDIFLEKQGDGLWQVNLPMPPKGNYVYKYVVDGQFWMSDLRNFYREEDGYGAFNSQFFVA